MRTVLWIFISDRARRLGNSKTGYKPCPARVGAQSCASTVHWNHGSTRPGDREKSSCRRDPRRVSADETTYEDFCVKSVLLSAGRHRPVPSRVGLPGCRGGAPRGEGALANLVSGGTASTPRSHVRVGGAPRRAAPLYISGAVRQPTSHHGHRSLGPTGPAPPRGSGPIRRSACAGAPPASIPRAVLL